MSLLDALLSRLSEALTRPRLPRSWRCACGGAVFFGNSQCLRCGRELGFDPQRLALVNLPARADDGTPLQRCDNAMRVACNWLLSEREALRHGGLCRACRLNRTVPSFRDLAAVEAWGRLEAAKRRLVSQLLALGLPVQARQIEDPARGLAFDFLVAYPDQPVRTGHLAGLITVDLAEADDVHREQVRRALREPYRTLLGHLRHEVGHYYWDRLVAGSRWLEPFRARFGDERLDYGQALQRHYQQGPAPDWQDRCVSAYASSHPWEDWAETFAHYLHMLDAVETALSYGVSADDIEMPVDPFGPDVLDSPDDAPAFLRLVNGWLELTTVLNELSRAVGQPDLVPFVLSRGAVAKLHLVHCVVRGR